jgi:type 1 glutamine amidotransferase
LDALVRPGNRAKQGTDEGVHPTNSSNGKARQPVTIVHAYNGGRTFFTSLGVPSHLADDNFRRLLENAIFWTTERTREKMKKG